MEITGIIKELAIRGVYTSIDYDADKEMFYVDLNTLAKSSLKLYEDGTIFGRYDYEEKIDLDMDVDDILHSLCNEFAYALHGRKYGNLHWFALCKEFKVKCETYI